MIRLLTPGQLTRLFRHSSPRGATSPPTPTARPGFGWQAAMMPTGTPLDFGRTVLPGWRRRLQRQRQLRRQLQRLLRPPQRRQRPQHTRNGDGHCHSISNRDGHRHRISNGDTTTRNSIYANTAASADATATSIAPVAASLPATPKLREGGCEAQARNDCKCG